MTSRRESAVTTGSSARAIRRSVIALGGGACAAVGAVFLANAARPQLHAEDTTVAARPIIIDGPPTNVEAAPPPPPRRRVRHRAEPFMDEDGDYQNASEAGPNPAGPGEAPQAPQAPMRPPQPGGQMQTAQMQSGQMQSGRMSGQSGAGPAYPCAGYDSPADQMVCASPRLNAAEVAIQRLYDMDLYRTDNPDALRDEQRRWRAARDQAAAEGGPEALAEVYAERIQELDGPY